jgi:hypothetical protein
MLKKNRSELGKKGLQICAEGSKSTKRPTLVVSKNPNGKSRFKLIGEAGMGV